MNNPLVSVIMPVYNCENYIEESLLSIINQTYDCIEIIVVDDCSTDDTLAKIAALGAVEPRIRVIEKSKNTGQADSLNIAMELVKGDFTARMDGDDVSLSTRIQKQVDFFNNNPHIGLVSCNYKILNTKQEIDLIKTNNHLSVGLLFFNQFVSTGSMWRTEVVNRYNLRFNPELTNIEDYDFFVRLSKYTSLANLSDALVLYRIHENNVTHDFIPVRRPYALSIFNYQLNEVGIKNINDILVELKPPINEKEFIAEIKLLFHIFFKNMRHNRYNGFVLLRYILQLSIYKINKFGRRRSFLVLFPRSPFASLFVFIPKKDFFQLRPMVKN